MKDSKVSSVFRKLRRFSSFKTLEFDMKFHCLLVDAVLESAAVQKKRKKGGSFMTVSLIHRVGIILVYLVFSV